MIKSAFKTGRVPVKIWTDDIEAEAIEQLDNLANLPFIYKHVAVMPDAHAGKGSTVGTVIATKGAIIPSAVGVDIGCGMMAVKVENLKAEQLASDKVLKALRDEIEKVIPVGFHQNKEITKQVELLFNHNHFMGDLSTSFETSLIRNDNNSNTRHKILCQMGSLGGGNHFIEICLDLKNKVWIVLHSGSRNIGKTVADFHINGAKGLMKKMFIDLKDPDLAYLVQTSSAFEDYIHDLHWCQNYALLNREVMMERILEIISKMFFDSYTPPILLREKEINCHHNYTQMENHFGEDVWVTRKGAVSAQKGQLGIIPGSMGTKSYIVRGLGNVESFCSCSHGAGRRMSRTQARKQFTIEDFEKQTAGVECRKDADVLDEIPGAYKDIDTVMENQADLVEIVETLKQVICIKG
jgi:tRNA-splicing ligase RtcB